MLKTPKRVIARDNLPQRPPFMFIIVVALLLDRLGAPGWLWGVIGTLLALLVVIWAVDIFYHGEDHIDVFKSKDAAEQQTILD